MLLQGALKGKVTCGNLVIEDAKAETSPEKTQRQQVPSQGNSCCLCRLLDRGADSLALHLTGDG